MIRQFRCRLYFLYLLLPVLGGVTGCNDQHDSDPRIREAKLRGEEIADNLFRYQRTTGRFPARLAEITPHFLTKILPPMDNDEWLYSISANDQHFQLGFKAEHGTARFWYLPDEKKWMRE